ncbi:MAG: hypothetical protein ABJB12_23250, partial [Pseudomonadota bacterium]
MAYAGLLLAACDRGAHGAPGAASASPSAEVVAAPSASAFVPVPIGPVPAFAALVRAERWADARAAIEAMPDAQRAQPEVRFVHARVDCELNDGRAALGELLGLENALPVLSTEIAAARARAQLQVG